MSNTPAIRLHNASVDLSIDTFGGALIAFTIAGNPVNPLSFAFDASKMPENNRGGAVYQGHFACIGRWGEVSPAEKNAGVPNHGEPANILWQVEEVTDKHVKMSVTAAREGLHVNRVCFLDEQSPVFLIKETVSNINPIGRPFSITQHPTLSAPFLDSNTIIACNATYGFDQVNYANVAQQNVLWKPHFLSAYNDKNEHYNAVFSFVVNRQNEYGWIMAYSPINKLLLGYVWKRKDYPWIHHWQHFNEESIQYRGIEFGTAGIHQPFKQTIYTATSLFGERTLEWIEPSEKITKSYFGFMHSVNDLGDVKDVTVTADAITITTGMDSITLHLSNNLANGLHQ